MVVSIVESDRCRPVRIDLLSRVDWPDLRSARLAALCDSPDAFVAALDRELQRGPREWIDSIERLTWVAAREGVDVCGIMCLTAPDPDAPNERYIESVWVAPRHRRQGLVRRMLQKLEEQARAEGAERLQFWVLETNSPAYDAYLKLSFNEMPEREQDSKKMRPDGSFVKERLMVKLLL